MDLYRKIIGDKGSKKADTDNEPLTNYLLDEDEELGFLNSNVISTNVLFSGSISSGIPIGKISMISADSKSGKSILSLSLMKSAQQAGMTVILIDTENSADYKVIKQFGIDTSKDKLMVFQENNIEAVRNIIAKIFDGLTKEERRKIFLVIDSWGALITTRTIDNAVAGKTVKDMSEAQLKNSLAGLLNNTKATTFIINHIYQNVGGFGDLLLIPGGKRAVFLSSTIILINGRSKEKNSDGDVTGYILNAKTFKSRWSKENTELKFRIKVNGGLDPFYGLLDDALEGGYVVTEKQGYYIRNCIENDKPIKERDLYTSDFWIPIFKKTDFKDYIEKKYKYTNPLDLNNTELSDMFTSSAKDITEAVEDTEKKVKKTKKVKEEV